MPASRARLEYVALAALGGNMAAQQLSVLPGYALLASLALLGVCLCCVSRRTLLPGIAILFFCLTAFVALQRIADRWNGPGATGDFAVHGWVDEFPVADEGRVVFTLRTADAGAVSLPERLRLTWYEPPLPLKAGDSLDLGVRIRAPRGLANPGGFDYERWLLTEAIGATGYVRDGRPDAGRSYGIPQAWLRFRQRAADSIGEAITDPSAAALFVALTLGVRTGFEDRHWEVLRRTGTSHLVAISGLHVGLIAVFSFQLLLHGALRLPPSIARRAWLLAAALTLLPTAVYAAMAGFALPTVRALVMLGVAEAVMLSRRRVAPFAALGMALLAILVLDPLATLGTSFWLSFGAVGAILVYLTRRAAKDRPADDHVSRDSSSLRRSRVLGAVITLAQIQLVVGCALLPLGAIFFGEVSLAGFAVNLLAVPFFSFVLVPASLLLAAAAILDVGSRSLGGLIEPLGSAVWQVLGDVSAWRFASVPLPQASLLAAGLFGAGVVLILAASGRRRWLGIAACAPLLFRSPARPDAGSFVLTVLDVGHGLAAVVRTESRTLLFDTGPLARSGFDAGREIVLPALGSLSPDALDLIMISHGDSDHAGGLPAVRARYAEAVVLAGPDFVAPGADACSAGQHWTWDGVDFSVLHPARGFTRIGNDSSCVLRIDGAGGSVLLTGDIEGAGERALVAGGAGPVDVVVAPHHGSATSSSAALVAATRPAHVIVSAAHANRWNFPRPEVVSRWRNAGAKILVTGDSGAITVDMSAGGAEVEQWRDRHRRYWRASSGTGTSSAL